ncbi:MAG: tetratricopeptide repeat protein [Planctomycetes bacterium]|nr:tetratricopeptide repeat protein [Planctomycetota bacterium]
MADAVERVSSGAQNKPTPGDRAVGSVRKSGMTDVWSRSGSKYRIRAVVLLAVNVLLFAGAGSFAFWLRSGERLAPAREGYWDLLVQTFGGVGRAEVSLGSLLIGPISVQDVPVLIPIVGLLMAALISIPILVAILYRFWSSLPFIAVVGFLAVMPWLAITLLGSCILASVKPFRTRFRFMSALIGLVPAIVYLVLAWGGTHEIVVGKIDPVDGIKFVAPWVLAIVASAGVFAIVLAIADLVDYRPGAVTPLLAVMFGLPVALFEQHVGRDALYYRLLEKRDQAHFADVDASVDWTRAAQKAWEQHPLPKPSWEATKEIAAEKWLFELAADLGPYQSELTKHQVELSDRCDWFHKNFPDSPFAPNALFIKARAWDQRVDLREFRRTKWIRFYDDFPNAASRDTWRILLENRPQTALGAVAGLKLARLDAREGDVDRAISKLEALIARFDTPPATIASSDEPNSPGSPKSVLDRETPEASLRIPLRRVVLEAHRLHDLLVSNRDPLYGYDPISGSRSATAAQRYGLLDRDPRHDRYVDHLRSIKRQYPKCQIEDNIDLELAIAAPSEAAKIHGLEALLERFHDRDAAPEALLRLGIAYRAAGRARKGDEAFAQLIRRFPESIWARQANDHVGPMRRVTVTRAGL